MVVPICVATHLLLLLLVDRALLDDTLVRGPALGTGSMRGGSTEDGDLRQRLWHRVASDEYATTASCDERSVV